MIAAAALRRKDAGRHMRKSGYALPEKPSGKLLIGTNDLLDYRVCHSAILPFVLQVGGAGLEPARQLRQQFPWSKIAVLVPWIYLQLNGACLLRALTNCATLPYE